MAGHGSFDDAKELEGLLGSPVVLDTRGELLYLGKLLKVHEHFYELEDADVHDLLAGRTSKELYVIDARRNGVKKNRARVLVRKSEIVSLSKLEDVLLY